MTLNITINKATVAASFAAGATVATAVTTGGTTPYVYSLATGSNKFAINSSTGIVTTIATMDINNISPFSVTVTDSTTGTVLTVTSGVTYPLIQAKAQSKFNKPNVIYKITKDIDLGNGVLTIPVGCTLDFQGGSISNGNIIYQNTTITNICKYSNIIVTGKVTNPLVYLSYYGAVGDGVADDSTAINNALTINSVVQGDKNKIYKANIVFSNSGVTLQNAKIKGNISFKDGLRFIKIQSVEVDATGNDYGIYAETNVTKLYIDDCYVHGAQVITDPSTIDDSGGPGTAGYNYKKSIGAGIALWDCWDSILTRISTSSNEGVGFTAYQFNNGTFLGTAYNNTIGINILGSTGCRIEGTIQENKNTGLLLEAVHGSVINVYLEQNGYTGTTLESKSQLVVGHNEATCIGTNITAYAMGGAGSSMVSTHGVLLNYASSCNVVGYAIRHAEAGLRITSGCSYCKANFVDTTHQNYDYDKNLIPNIINTTSIVDCNTQIDINELATFYYVILNNAGVLSSYEQVGANIAIIRATDAAGIPVACKAKVYIQTTDYGIYLTK